MSTSKPIGPFPRSRRLRPPFPSRTGDRDTSDRDPILFAIGYQLAHAFRTGCGSDRRVADGDPDAAAGHARAGGDISIQNVLRKGPR